MRGIKNNLIKTGYMTDEQKMELAWNDLEIAVHNHDLKRIFNLAYWIKSLLAKYSGEDLPVIK